MERPIDRPHDREERRPSRELTLQPCFWRRRNRPSLTFIALYPLLLNVATAQSSDGQDLDRYAGPVSPSSLAGSLWLHVAQVLAVDVKCLMFIYVCFRFLP